MLIFHSPSPLRHCMRLCAVTLMLAGSLAHAAGKLVDGFGVDQILGGGVVTGVDILTGNRDLLAFAPSAPDAVRVENGRLWIDTQTLRVVARYTTVAPDTLYNFSLDEVNNLGDWLLTYRSTQAATLTLAWTTEPEPGARQRGLIVTALAPSPAFMTLNLGPLVAPEFALYRTRSFALQLDFVPAPGSFELDSLAIAAPVPEPASVALWMAGLAAVLVCARRTARAG